MNTFGRTAFQSRYLIAQSRLTRKIIMPAPFTHLSLGYEANIVSANQTLNPSDTRHACFKDNS